MIDVLLSADGLLPDWLEPDWTRLLEASAPPRFPLDFEVMRSWAASLRGAWTPLTVVVREAGLAIGIAPLMIRRERRLGLWPHRRIRFLGSQSTDFSTFLAAPANLRRVVFMVLDKLRSGGIGWETIVLDDLRGDRAAAAAVAEWAASRRADCHETNGRFYYIDLKKPWPDILAGTSRDFVRRNVNLARNRLARRGPWSVLADPGLTGREIAGRAARLHIPRQESLGRVSPFRDRALRGHVEVVLERARAAGILRSFWLRAGDRDIAYLLGFDSEGVFYAWNMAFDPSDAAVFPSKLLLFEALKACHERGLAEFDFMRGETSYKSMWTKDWRANRRFVIRNRCSVFGNLSALAEDAAGRLRGLVSLRAGLRERSR